MLPLIQLAGGKSYVVEEADISSFAGKTGLLMFSAPPHVYATFNLLDDIQFSPNPLSVPEPATCSLILGGVAVFGPARWKRVL